MSLSMLLISANTFCFCFLTYHKHCRLWILHNLSSFLFLRAVPLETHVFMSFLDSQVRKFLIQRKNCQGLLHLPNSPDIFLLTPPAIFYSLCLFGRKQSFKHAGQSTALKIHFLYSSYDLVDDLVTPHSLEHNSLEYTSSKIIFLHLPQSEYTPLSRSSFSL